MKFAIYTLGCRVNQYESRAIAEHLSSLGHKEEKFDKKCDVYIINSCAVTAESVRKSKQITRRAKRNFPNAEIILIGCTAQISDTNLIEELGCDYVIGNKDKYKNTLSAIFGEIEEKSVASLDNADYENYIISNSEKVREYVKIEDGCEGKCAYCIIPKARGPVRSKSFQTVIDEIKELVKRGVKEIILTGIEISSYEYSLTDLLCEVDNIEGLQRFSCGSIEPTLITKEFVDKIKNLKKLTPHFHLSIQSGSTTVLNRMKRKYTSLRAMQSIALLRDAIPNVQFTCDIIVGFPGETEDEFAQTMKFMSEADFLHAHIFTYSKRPGTLAAEMYDQIPENVKNQRSARLSELCKEIKAFILQNEINTRKEVPILVEQYKNGLNIGHSDNYIEYHIKSDKDLSGKIVYTNPKSTNGEIIFA